MAADETTDQDLVAQSLAGHRDAFGKIVARYQSLVCSIAYNSTGSITHSEDVGQDVFLNAWRQLRQLREPAKLRPWLCGIARHIVSNHSRRGTREPVHGASALEDLPEASASELLPSDQMINREEEAILWRSLDRIPTLYREPLILYYREHRSVARVAAALELSEEAVKQRLSRGRKMLHDEVIAFVEGSLAQTAPGPEFTAGVLSALPPFAAAGVSGAWGASAAKAAASKSLAALLLGPGLWFAGAILGTSMMVKNTDSLRERKFVRAAWAGLWASTGLFIIAMVVGLNFPAKSYWQWHPRLLAITVIGAALTYGALAGLCGHWMTRTARRIRQEEAAKAGVAPAPGAGACGRRYEYRSARAWLGVPLVHVRFNCVEGGKILPAKGWIALGSQAYGIVFAYGAVAVAPISVGALALGIVAIGGAGVGILAFGGASIGVAAIGGFSAGYIAFGGGAVGWLAAAGGGAIARHIATGGAPWAEHANDAVAQAFMQSSFFFRHAEKFTYILSAICWLPAIFSLAIQRRWDRSHRANPAAAPAALPRV